MTLFALALLSGYLLGLGHARFLLLRRRRYLHLDLTRWNQVRHDSTR
jgi:hypothetical protein